MGGWGEWRRRIPCACSWISSIDGWVGGWVGGIDIPALGSGPAFVGRLKLLALAHKTWLFLLLLPRVLLCGSVDGVRVD